MSPRCGRRDSLLTTRVTHPERRHNHALDGVRGLAILIVLIHHGLLPVPANGRLSHVLAPFIHSCWIGVDLFFALSGFLITGILVDTLGSREYLRNFYVRRFLRIFPLYYAVLLLAGLTSLLLYGNSGLWRMMLPLAVYLQNTGLWTPLDHYNIPPFTLNHFWSLAVEEQFYTVWPLLVFWIRDRSKLLRLALALSVCALLLRVYLSARGVSPWFLYSFTACRADALLLGGALALLFRSEKAPVVAAVRHYAPWCGLLAFAAVVIVSFRVDGLDWYGDARLHTYGFTLLAIAACGLLATTQGDAPRVLSQPWLRFLGKYSYGLYVLHRLFTASLIHALHHWLLPVLRSDNVSSIAAWTLAWAFTLGLTMASFRWFESPFLRLKHRFEYTRTA